MALLKAVRRTAVQATMGTAETSDTISASVSDVTQAISHGRSILADIEPRSCRLGASLTTSNVTTTRDTTDSRAILWDGACIEFQSGVTVQRGTQAITGTSHDVTLSSLDLTKSFISYLTWITDEVTFDNADHFMAYLWDDTGTKKLRIEVDSAPANSTVYYEVVEYDDCTVTRGSTSMGTTTTSITPSIGTTVDLGKSILFYSYKTDQTTEYQPSTAVHGKFNSTTNLSFVREEHNSVSITDLRWEVVEFNDGTEVEAVDVTHNSGDSNPYVDTTLSTVTPLIDSGNAVFFFCPYQSGRVDSSGAQDWRPDAGYIVEYLNTTSVRSRCYAKFRSKNANYTFYVAQFGYKHPYFYRNAVSNHHG